MDVGLATGRGPYLRFGRVSSQDATSLVLLNAPQIKLQRIKGYDAEPTGIRDIGILARRGVN